ncbi:MAG TPA: ArsR family transcriptional regulator [Archaeoglobaceae archaeon]|nr:ArsR family transcriptional regulator [Archaeoglobaceae archaeon]
MYQKNEYSKNRRAILIALFKQPMDFTALKDETRLSEPTLSKHLRDLLNSRFIEVKVEGRRKIYNITEKGLNSELRMYLAGIDSALKVLESGKNFWKTAGMEAVKMVSAGNEALNTFIQALARHSPIEYADERKGKEIFDGIVSKIASTSSKLEKLRKNIEEVEMRGGDADALREKFREKLDAYTAIYFALGPPFSYMWKNMCEELE